MNIPRVQLHTKFVRLFGGDPAFEQAVLDHLKRLHGTDSLYRVPDQAIQAACDKPLLFRYRVDEERGGTLRI